MATRIRNYEKVVKVEDLVQERPASRPGSTELLKLESPMGCKCVGSSLGYVEALVKDNVEVVTTGIDRVTASGYY